MLFVSTCDLFSFPLKPKLWEPIMRYVDIVISLSLCGWNDPNNNFLSQLNLKKHIQSMILSACASMTTATAATTAPTATATTTVSLSQCQSRIQFFFHSRFLRVWNFLRRLIGYTFARASSDWHLPIKRQARQHPLSIFFNNTLPPSRRLGTFLEKCFENVLKSELNWQ